MSFGEIAFLVLVLSAFAAFIGTVGFISIWSGQPAKSAASPAITGAQGSVRAFKRAA